MIVECPGCQTRHDVSGRPAGTRARCRCGTVFELPEPPRSAGALQCPQCAGAVQLGARACEFCSAALMVKACPRCFGKMFHGAKHCSHCGTVVDIPVAAGADGNAVPRVCPRCPRRSQLVGHLVDGCLLDGCDACGGVFVDNTTLERVIDTRRQSSAMDAMGMPRRITGVTPVQGVPTGPMYIACPDCGALMTRRNFGRSSGILIDVCAHHGTWLDADELPRIIEFVSDGGLERADRKDAERKREEARAAAAAAAVRPSSLAGGGVEVDGAVQYVVLGGLLGAFGRILRG